MCQRTPLQRFTRLLLPLLLLNIANVSDAMEARVIYLCKTEQSTTFSDTPCGSDARTYEPDDRLVSRYTPNEVASTRSKDAGATSAKKNRQKSATSNDRSTHENDCKRLDIALRDIARKMRSGYTARQGERLKERKSTLEQKRRDQHCR